MEFALADLARMLGAQVDGPADRHVSNLAKIEEAGPKDIAFLANPAYEPYLYSTEAAAVLVKSDFKPQQPTKATLIRVADPYSAFTKLLELADQAINMALRGREEPSYVATGVELPDDGYVGAFAYIAKGVKLGKGVKVYPHVFIGEGAVIGEGTVIYSGAKIYAGSRIGARCILHSGSVVGSDGFGHAPQADGSYRKIPQLGVAVLEDDVEVGANTVVDRATMGQTLVKRGTKLDNLIQIAHNVTIGEHSVIAAQTGIAGSTVLGNYAMLGGQVGISGHLKLGDKFRAGAQSGIISNFEDGATVMGYPAFDLRKFQRASVLFRKLPDLEKRIADLEKNTKEQ